MQTVVCSLLLHVHVCASVLVLCDNLHNLRMHDAVILYGKIVRGHTHLEVPLLRAGGGQDVVVGDGDERAVIEQG